MLEAQALGGVVELDVDAQVVAVHLQLVAGHDPAGLVDVEPQVGDLTLDVELPMAVRGGFRVEGDPRDRDLVRVDRGGHAQDSTVWDRSVNIV